MDAHRDEYTVLMMCRVLNVSTSGYYKWLNAKDLIDSEVKEYKETIRRKIKKSYHESEGTYGSPRVHSDLVEWGFIISERTVGRIMQELGLRAIPEEKYVVTTDSDHAMPVYPNELKQQFTFEEPNTAWVADITYVWTLEGWVYLSTVMDLFSRKIVGWSMDSTMKKELPLKALNMAIQTRMPREGLIHHSDRGSQYCSTRYINVLDTNKIKISMSRKGNPYDNACIESFHATIKKEWIYRKRFTTREEAVRSINYYIGSFYNERRKHSTLGYLSPNNYERKYQTDTLNETLIS
ncbi:IS3 family transposase [Metabacillus indicus]|uniref:IS3 family transposase n=1 Tax=Metabacillus indicus TaxID=246786 RepID=UPI00317E86D6